MLAHSKLTQAESYDTSRSEVFDTAAARLRQEYIPKSRFSPNKLDKEFDASKAIKSNRERVIKDMRFQRSALRGASNRWVLYYRYTYVPNNEHVFNFFFPFGLLVSNILLNCMILGLPIDQARRVMHFQLKPRSC